MRNKIDFIYEYSDLNLFHTRVKVLTGKYAGIVLEFGGSILSQAKDWNSFTFEYTLYEVPDTFYVAELRNNKEFNEFLGYLLVDVVTARKNDPEEHNKLMEAASAEGKAYANIKIADKWYPNKMMVYKEKQPNTSLGDF